MKAKNYQKAWEMALKLIPGDYSKDEDASVLFTLYNLDEV